TVSELNSKEFQIERSKDGITYQMLGTVTAAGNSNSLKYYTYSDNDILSGKSYYRLKIVDLDQTFKYTVVNELNCEETTSELSVHYSGETGIVIKSQLSSSTDFEIEIFDILGKKINSTSKRINSGTSVTFLNTDGILSDGVYLISIYNTNGSNILTKKVVVK
ncbi:MAG TPA: T9SS type A sorting domain-containing protein, partial [Chitinophagales bacterium]|nr:T9SS type A sorting domain-containing protein [Chitinophagales bacterium]